MAGGDGVDADAVAAVLNSHLAGGGNKGGFAGFVDEGAGGDEQAVNTGNVDDAAATSTAQVGHAELSRQVAGLDEDGHGAVVDVGRDVFGAAGHGFQGGIGVVDDDVETAPTVDGGLDHGLDLVDLTDVGGAGGGDAAGVLDAGRALPGALGVDVGDEDGGAFGCEAFGDGAADAGGSAGHHRSAVLESRSSCCHGSLSFDMSHAVAGAGLRAALREDRVRPLLEGRGRRLSGFRTRWRYWPV